jgi:orotidine-5'-phosphate decarboxylase
MEGGISQHGKQFVPKGVGSRESEVLFLRSQLELDFQLLTPDIMAAPQVARAVRAELSRQNVGRELIENLNPFKRVLRAHD